MIDFSAFAPGEVVDIFDGKPIVRTVDGSIRIDRFDSNVEISTGMVLK
jgi:UDP-4-amino-4-deoxy-L-arabinose formyltransferase/UDP-glucuronic acid dehydrogenase (UDP-4-keto-hexauronic acid decarboxylating)